MSHKRKLTLDNVRLWNYYLAKVPISHIFHVAKEAIAMNIARLRQEAGLRQVGLARAMGVDRSTIAKWESGLSAPKSVVLPRLADALECNIEKLFELPVEQTAQ